MAALDPVNAMKEPQWALLVAEYRAIATLANHIDTVRNILTSFFITLNGGLLVLVPRALSDDWSGDALGSGPTVLLIVMALVAMIGALMVMTIARFRRVQLERYVIANRILDRVLLEEDGGSHVLRDIVNLKNSQLTISDEAKMTETSSGSFFWTLVLIVPTAALSGAAVFLLLSEVSGWLSDGVAAPIGISVVAATMTGLVMTYLRLAKVDAPGQT